MATVKRKTTGVRRSAAAKSRAAKARSARTRTQGGVNRALALLPFDDDQLHRIFLAIIIGGAVALAWFVASLAGVPAMAQNEVAKLASDAGLRGAPRPCDGRAADERTEDLRTRPGPA